MEHGQSFSRGRHAALNINGNNWISYALKEAPHPPPPPFPCRPSPSLKVIFHQLEEHDILKHPVVPLSDEEEGDITVCSDDDCEKVGKQVSNKTNPRNLSDKSLLEFLKIPLNQNDKDLRAQCSDLIKNLSINNFVKGYALACHFNDPQWLSVATDYFYYNFKEIIETKEWLDFSADCTTESIKLTQKFAKFIKSNV